MTLPLSRTGTICLQPRPGHDPECILDRLARALREIRAKEVRREPGAVVFVGGMFRRVPRSNLLGPIGWGRIEVVRQPTHVEVRYRLVFTELIAMTIIPFGVMSSPLVAGGSGYWLSLAIPMTGVCAVAIGVSIAIALVRFPAFIRREGAVAGSSTVTA